MVSIQRLPGPKNPAEMTYYVQVDGAPIAGTSAAKTLSMVDSQTMALTLGYFVQVQAERTIIFLVFLGAVGGRSVNFRESWPFHPHHVILGLVPFSDSDINHN